MNSSFAPDTDPRQDKATAKNIKQTGARREKKPPKKITEKYLYNSGLAYLQRFTSSIPNFRRVMTRKIDKSCNYHKDQDREACIALLDGAVATFQRQGLLDDSAYTQGMVNSLRRRGLSVRAIQYKLQQKGLGAENILAALRAFDGDRNALDCEIGAAVQLMRRKKLGCYAAAQSEKHLAALGRAGFTYEVASKALALDMDEAEAILRERPY